ncbi:hypothetical protein [Burkholderia orbicola]|uniref:hypothetical protein n=1 Tax=Burkholderia orbicola TaxID=2978683 RepID=UPI002FE32694
MKGQRIDYGQPTGVYLLIEQLHAKSGLPSLANTIGSSNLQIYRTVAQLYETADIYVDNQRALAGEMTMWQMLKGAFGIDVVTRPNGKTTLVLEYAGFVNNITPLPKIGNLLPEFMTNEYALKVRSPYIFGTDPLPDIQLYRHAKSVFMQRHGGQSPATAMAKYHRRTRELIRLNTISEIDNALRDLRTALPSLNF